MSDIIVDGVPRLLKDRLPDCPVCGSDAVASVSGEFYQVETEPETRIKTCYDIGSDSVWIHFGDSDE